MYRGSLELAPPFSPWRLSRRRFLCASAMLAVSRWVWAETSFGPALRWELEDRGNLARESITGSNDVITSRTRDAIWVGEGSGRALRLDGYSTWINHASGVTQELPGAITITAWVALEAYPVHDAAIVQIGGEPASGLLIDKWGHLQFSSGPVDAKNICRSEHAAPRGRWVHLAATVSSTGEVSLYQDAVLCGHLAPNLSPAHYASAVILGKWDESLVVAGAFPTGVVNGLIRDVQIFANSLPASSMEALVMQTKPVSPADLELNRAWCATDKQRPLYHTQPPRAWTNEPHGCIYWRGRYHLFYQKNANGPYWGNINWGHMTSPNLYQWKEQPAALSPEPGPDAEGCWSGSVIDHDGKLALVYTGGDGKHASICVAMSQDGVRFDKYAGNPVIAAPPEGFNYPEFRDPFVWREDSTYYLIIGSAVKDVGGAALLYRSDDLLTWKYLKPLFTGDKVDSGAFWEMPIFVKVGEYHVLIVCEVPGRASYWVGTWKDETFTPLSAAPQRLELFNHLLSPTPHTAVDRRVVTMGIIPDQRSPIETWKAGWAHLYSLPRVLSVDAAGHLHQNPLEEIRQWRQPLFSASEALLNPAEAKTFAGASGTGLEIEAHLKRGASQSVSLFVRRSPDGKEQTELRYEWEIETLTLDRSRSSLDPHVKRDIQSTSYKTEVPGEITLLLYLDVSVLEAFVDKRAAFATRIYPTLAESTGIAAGCAGGVASISSLQVSRIVLDAHSI